MTIAQIAPRLNYTCNGVTVDFPYSYPVLNPVDFLLYSVVDATGVPTLLTYIAHYTFLETPDAAGGYPGGVTIHFPVAPAATLRLVGINSPLMLQQVDLVNNDSLPVDTQVERPLDRLTLICQRLYDLISRTLRQPDSDVATIGTMPAKEDRLSKYLGFDGVGNPTALAAPTTTSLTTAFSQTVLDDPDAATARTTLGAASAASLATDEGILASLQTAVLNPIINGCLEIWQRGTSFVAIGNNAYAADRFKVTYITSGVVTVNRSANVPSVAQAGVLFNYSLEIDVTTADAAVAVNDVFLIQHKIEGYNWRHLAQRACTLSFWVSSTKTGAHGIALVNTGSDREFYTTFTINVADTWEFKTVNIPASPSAGTWDYVSGVGVEISWCLMSGTDRQAAVTGAWSTPGANIIRTSAAQVNVLDNAANFFRLTGVKLEIGSVATSLQFMPFEHELARCCRYYQKSFPYATAPAQNTGTANGGYMMGAYRAGALSQPGPMMSFQVRLRSAVSPVFYNPFAANTNMRDLTLAADCGAPLNDNAENGINIRTVLGNAGTGAGNQLAIHWSVDAEL